MTEVTTNAVPAILGGQPAFGQLVPIVRPAIPSFDSLADDLAEIYNSGMLTKGRHVVAFEKEVAAHLEVQHAIAVSNCTTGLMLAYRCLGLAGEVVVPSFTFMATVSALVWLGIRPVFVDVDEETCNIDPEAAEAAITPRTTAIVAVHTFGNPSNIDALVRLAQRYDVRLVFDAAHGLGTLYQGKPVGAQGDAQVYSLSPTKLVVAGEGGIVATNDDALAERIRQGREYGMGAGYDSVMAGPNARLSEPHALLARRSLAMLDEGIARRHEIVEVYRDELERIPGIRLQRIRAEDRSSYKDFTIAVDADAFGTTRDVLKVALLAENIDTRNYYNPPVHRQSAYRMFAPPEESLVNTNKLCGQCITLPLWSMMEPEMARGICQAIGRIHGFAEQVDDRARAGALGIVI